MSNFKIALTVIFIVCIIGAIGIFALSKATSTTTANLVVWGTIPEDTFNVAYKSSSLQTNKTITLSYIRKDPATFDQAFVEALANGAGPDIVIFRDDSVYKNQNKLFIIPFASYSESTFKNNFIEEGYTLLDPAGVVGLPFMVDPLVMYWNRDMFTNNLIAQTPQYWDEIYPLINKITRRDSSGTVLQSAIALGEWSNITSAKEIISMFLLQAGTPITIRATGGKIQSVLNDQMNQPIAPSESAINFYTQFSNPTSPAYTWNRSLPSSLNLFLSGNLAMYLGFASEISAIQQKNSNLNFDVALVPQIRGVTKKNVFAHMYSLSIVKQSQQVPAAFTAVAALTESAALTALGNTTNLPPVLRSPCRAR